jgi:hypothetical protein
MGLAALAATARLRAHDSINTHPPEGLWEFVLLYSKASKLSAEWLAATARQDWERTTECSLLALHVQKSVSLLSFTSTARLGADD